VEIALLYYMTLSITQTPMRLTLGGGGTDVIWYSRLHGGAWISAALTLYVRVFVARRKDDDLIRTSLETTEVVDDYRKLTNPIVQECVRQAGVSSGVDIYAISDASPRSGLGGSGAFEVGLLHALYTYKGKSITQLELAQQAADIEIQRLKKPVGPQDQYITALGGIRYFEIDKKGNVFQERLKIHPEIIERLQSNLLFFKTGMQHDTAAILGDQKKQVETGGHSDSVIYALDEIKELGREVKMWLEKGRVDDVGSSFHTHWLIKRRLSEKVSNANIDAWYEEAIKAGALGGKIMGAGGGGWFVFYVPKQKNKFRDRMRQIGLEERNVQFDFTGTRVILNQQ